MVDQHREGQGYTLLISLRETKNKGDMEEFIIERHVRGGFTSNYESFQTKIAYPTNRLLMKVIFPKQRTPKKVMLLEQTSGRKLELTSNNFRVMADGKQQVSWSTSNPKLLDVYTLAWHW